MSKWFLSYMIGKKAGEYVEKKYRDRSLGRTIFSVVLFLFGVTMGSGIIRNFYDLIVWRGSVWGAFSQNWFSILVSRPVIYLIFAILVSVVPLAVKVGGSAARRGFGIGFALKLFAIPFVLSTYVFEIIAMIVAAWQVSADKGITSFRGFLVSVVWGIVIAKLYKNMLNKGMAAVNVEYDNLQQENLQNLLALAEKEYGLDHATEEVFAGYEQYDLAKYAPASPDQWYYYDDKNLKAYHTSGIKTIYVRNDDRLEAIVQLLHTALAGTAAANVPIESLIEDVLYNRENILRKYALPGSVPTLRFRQLNAFVAQRQREMENLFQVRMRSYITDYKGMKAGLDGEAALQQTLNMHSGAITNLENIRLEFGDDSVETDSIVITQSGVFAVEVKNYGADGAFRVIIEADGAWYKEYPPKRKGDEPEKQIMKNPYAQNDRHVAFLEDFVNDVLGRAREERVPVYNIIVIANDKVELSCSPAARQTLGRVGTVYNQIMQYTDKRLTTAEIDMLRAAFLERNCPPKAYPLSDYSGEMSRMVASYQRLYDYAVQTNTAIERCLTDNPYPDLPE